MSLWNDDEDAKMMAQEAAPDSAITWSIPVYLCITRNTNMGILHWVIAWEAFPADEPISITTPSNGWKVLEVRNPHQDSRVFALRFSFKANNNLTVLVRCSA